MQFWRQLVYFDKTYKSKYTYFNISPFKLFLKTHFFKKILFFH